MTPGHSHTMLACTTMATSVKVCLHAQPWLQLQRQRTSRIAGQLLRQVLTAVHRAQVVEENKRQLCVFQEAVHKQEPWLWWAFAADYAAHCTMTNGRFNDRACAKEQAEAAGLDFAAVEACMADSSKDAPHPLLEARRPCANEKPLSMNHSGAWALLSCDLAWATSWRMGVPSAADALGCCQDMPEGPCGAINA